MFTTIYLILLFKFIETTKIPTDFKFGTATAAYQVEGGWNASGKGENIWDRLTHTHPELIADHSTGDVACDSYHQWRRDIEVLKEIGVDFYRFSLSWTRIAPNGFINKLNTIGIQYYNDLINELIANNIEPIVTIYHWDLPQTIQEVGGWPNIEISKYFEDYATLVFQLYGDRVKKWITINEPASICEGTYGDSDQAPDASSPGIGDYLCGKTILVAHARAYHVYNSIFRSIQHGKIGITIDSIWVEPKTNSSKDIMAAERNMQMELGWWMHPIFSESGDYPQIMKDRINKMSWMENYTESRLPPLSPDEVKFIQGTADFLGLNHYHTWVVSDHEYPITYPTSFVKDKGTIREGNPNWKPFPNIVGWGLRKLLNWIKKEYNNPLIYITENGYGDGNTSLQDDDRVTVLKGFIQATMDAIMKDGCNVKRYTVWSIMDNMEWRDGYTIKFGIYHVDFKSDNRTRTAKKSAKFYQNIIKSRTL